MNMCRALYARRKARANTLTNFCVGVRNRAQHCAIVIPPSRFCEGAIYSLRQSKNPMQFFVIEHRLSITPALQPVSFPN